MSLSKWKRTASSARGRHCFRQVFQQFIHSDGTEDRADGQRMLVLLGLCSCKACGSSVFLAKQERIYGNLEEKECDDCSEQLECEWLVKHKVIARWHQGPTRLVVMNLWHVSPAMYSCKSVGTDQGWNFAM